MRILIVGHGAREHATARRLAEEHNDIFAFSTKPNLGLEKICTAIHQAPSYNVQEITQYAHIIQANIVVAANEQPLFDGLGEYLRENNILCFGPDSELARLELDKNYAKSIVTTLFPALSIPSYNVGSLVDARKVIDSIGLPIVIKTNTFSAGKAIKIVDEPSELDTVLKSFTQDHNSLQIEPYLSGKCVHVYCFTDGKTRLTTNTVLEYAFKEGNKEIKTGGMGSVSSPQQLQYLSNADTRIISDFYNVVLPYVQNVSNKPYQGTLVGQFIKTEDRLFFNEFDVRFGDPEFINVIESLDMSLTEVLFSIANQELSAIRMKEVAVVSICHVPPGYPADPKPHSFKLDEIFFDHLQIYWGNASKEGDTVRTGTSRTLVAVGIDRTIDAARQQALDLSHKINAGLCFREDIGLL